MSPGRHDPGSDWEVLLHGYADGELDAANALRCEHHLAECPDCAADLDALRDLKRRLSQESVRWPAPERLRARVVAAIDRQSAPARSPRALEAGRQSAGDPRLARALRPGAFARRARRQRHPRCHEAGAGTIVAGRARRRPCPLAPRRPPHRRRNLGPAYRQAVVQRPDRLLATRRRSRGARLSARRRTGRLHRRARRRRSRLSPQRTPHQRLRLAVEGPVSQRVGTRRLQPDGLRGSGPALLGRVGPQHRRTRGIPAGFRRGDPQVTHAEKTCAQRWSRRRLVGPGPLGGRPRVPSG